MTKYVQIRLVLNCRMRERVKMGSNTLEIQIFRKQQKYMHVSYLSMIHLLNPPFPSYNHSAADNTEPQKYRKYLLINVHKHENKPVGDVGYALVVGP